MDNMQRLRQAVVPILLVVVPAVVLLGAILHELPLRRRTRLQQPPGERAGRSYEDIDLRIIAIIDPG